MAEFHFLHPWWFLLLIPSATLLWNLLQRKASSHAWGQICDEHLLPWLIQDTVKHKQKLPLINIGCCLSLMIISLAGPTWSRLPVPTYQQTQSRVLVLDMTPTMLKQDLSPDCLSRAKFKIHDLLSHREAGQFGMLVYTGEPFVVSPLTSDGQTIDALLPSLTPDIMPTGGNRLDSALKQAKKLINQAGSTTGQILVLTATPPSSKALDAANKLARQGIDTSVLPITHNRSLIPAFSAFASAGNGLLIKFTDTSEDIEHWITAAHSTQRYDIQLNSNIPIWQDQGRWFLIPVLLLLLPLFRRGWIQRILP